MKDQNKYWEDLVSDLYNSEIKPTAPDVENSRFSHDYQWAIELKSCLKKVFLWDLFDKNKAKRRLDYQLAKNGSPTLYLFRKLWSRAAIILVAALSGALLQALLSGSFNKTLYTEVKVPLGQMTQINLSDGSKIWLNSGSVFKYPTKFDWFSREVYLDGEAYMEVAHNKLKPFTVNASKFSIKVLGTSFNVSAFSDDDEASVTLVEGAVLLNSEDKSWDTRIVPGEVATIEKGKMAEVSNVNTDFYTSWKEGKIVFKKETLEEIAKKMERWYNVEIRFKDEELKTHTFSGTFLKYKPVEQVFKSLSIMDSSIDFTVENRVSQKNIILIVNKNN